MNDMNRLIFSALILCALGCERRDTSFASPFQQESSDYVLLVAVDLSGSFRELMTEDGKAYELLLHAIDQYHRDGIGSDFQIIITQLSGNRRPLLWQGKPQQLRREFPDPTAFRDFLIAHGDADSSRINDGIAESIDYVLHTYSVAHGNARSVALILSDMEDTHDSQHESDLRLTTALTTFARRGNIGFYFCDQERMADIRQKMKQAGIDMYILECDIHGRPPLPSFE